MTFPFWQRVLKSSVAIALACANAVSFLPLPVNAASAILTVSPAVKTVAPGDIFSVNVNIAPSGETVDTVRARLSYPSDLLEAKAVSVTGPLASTAPGNGLGGGSVSWGVYTVAEPVTSSARLLTITFAALKEGTASVALQGSSLVLSDGNNVSGGVGGAATITIGKKAEGAPTAPGEPSKPVARPAPKLTSASHADPDAWYARRELTVAWTVTGAVPARYLVDFDKDPETEPRTAAPTGAEDATFTATEDGVWYAHVQSVFADGTRSPVSHLLMNVDSTPPESVALDPDARQIVAGEDVAISFGAIDAASGVKSFALSVNGGEYQEMESPTVLQDVPEGDTVVALKVTDNAGNTAYTSTRIRAYPSASAFAQLSRISPDASRALAQWELFTLLVIIMSIVLGILTFWRMSQKAEAPKRKGRKTA